MPVTECSNTDHMPPNQTRDPHTTHACDIAYSRDQRRVSGGTTYRRSTMYERFDQPVQCFCLIRQFIPIRLVFFFSQTCSSAWLLIGRDWPRVPTKAGSCSQETQRELPHRSKACQIAVGKAELIRLSTAHRVHQNSLKASGSCISSSQLLHRESFLFCYTELQETRLLRSELHTSHRAEPRMS
jgi:hypothetical protein